MPAEKVETFGGQTPPSEVGLTSDWNPSNLAEADAQQVSREAVRPVG